MKKLQYRYSSKKSKEFWDIVNSLKYADQQEMYSLGCALQNFEEYVLKQLRYKTDNKVADK